jgi:phosphopantetheinyl transferase
MPVGIDLEYVREKVVLIGPKFLSGVEMEFLNNDPILYTIAWSAKESIFKCQGRQGVSLKQNILLEPFSLKDKVLQGKIYDTEFSNHFYKVKVESDGGLVLTYTIW